jgi:hypothetical protein
MFHIVKDVLTVRVVSPQQERSGMNLLHETTRMSSLAWKSFRFSAQMKQTMFKVQHGQRVCATIRHDGPRDGHN